MAFKKRYPQTAEGLYLLEVEKKVASNAISTSLLTNSQKQRLRRLKGFSSYRFIHYLLDYQGETTAVVRQAIGVANVPDIAFKVRPQLLAMGLNVECRGRTITNKYGQTITVGCWFLLVDDINRWIGRDAANDSAI